MSDGFDFQVRLWPWSCEDDEIVFAKDGGLRFSYFGSPLFAVAEGVKLILPIRHERLIPHGPAFSTLSGSVRLYEAPHGVLASKSQQSPTEGRLGFTQGHRWKNLLLETQYAKTEKASNEDAQSPLTATVRSWSTFFDDCLDSTSEGNKNIDHHLDWDQMEKYLEELQNREQQEPRMALIVHLAEKMKARLAEVVHLSRRILLRERELLPAGRVAELDGACLRWYIRQPGETSAQKAAANGQRLLGVSRRESFDTLENRVLLDFINRCNREAHRYQAIEVGDIYRQSARAQSVLQYRNICSELSKEPVFTNVGCLSTRVRPNYVLQNDARYREVWRNYQRLLRQEDEEDRSWDWQSRTWADLVRMILNTALCSMPNKFIKQVLNASVRISKEQLLGQRLIAGAEPGPFALFSTNGHPQWILEAVHPDQATKHPVTKSLGRLGCHLYYVLNRIGSSERRVLAVWAIHCASSNAKPDWANISVSAANALKHHARILSDHKLSVPRLYGLVGASDDQSVDGDGELSTNGLLVLRLPTDYRRWATAISELVKPFFKMQLEEMCS